MDSFTTLTAQSVFDELNLDVQDDVSHHFGFPSEEEAATEVPADQERPGDGRKAMGAFCVIV
ncbi:pheromone Phb2.2 B44 [Coprinopsis cinerea okayama7|uniref:Pheromone Phb2.2 B44 n=1 Tax=Coprinopsis cinerea (strain Okayama-7 / 130 / ATCC MYA-4618 / FGSC 9003) TaxID=240176 RepID=A8NKA8_COPC7|nr:pheromone Phb2.2 B44 [Coprinopsis cinerea okayama7\|eukprot:XP_001834396.1 pheromone Phb2.2 B44 [Coprinopsis cinerea okayama7\